MRRRQCSEVIAQHDLGLIQHQILLVALGRYPHPAREQPLEMRGGHAHFARDPIELLGVLGLVNQGDGAAHHLIVVTLIFGRGGYLCDLCHAPRLATPPPPRDPFLARMYRSPPPLALPRHSSHTLSHGPPT